ncbi:MAG: hypothetical protein QG597_933 [Actinomycetota bacterium]|nr:hypothetical protein [Actinomycetota bacterium]
MRCMAYPKKLLADGEEIQFELRPHWRSLFFPIFWLLVIVGVAAFTMSKLSTWLDDGSAALSVLRWAIAIVALFLLVFLFVRPLIAWLTTQYVFTNRRVIVRTGFIARKGRDMPLSKVNNVMFEHTVFERFFNCGTLMIESASEHGMLVVANVPNVERVQREVYRLHDEDDAYRSARSEMYEAQFRTGQVPAPLLDSDGQPRQVPQVPPAPPLPPGQSAD